MSIEDLINSVTQQDFAKAGPTFAEIMATKQADALEQEKAAIADYTFNGIEPDDQTADEEEQMEMDLGDEDELDVDDEEELDDGAEEALEDDADEIEIDDEEDEE